MRLCIVFSTPNQWCASSLILNNAFEYMSILYSFLLICHTHTSRCQSIAISSICIHKKCSTLLVPLNCYTLTPRSRNWWLNIARLLDHMCGYAIINVVICNEPNISQLKMMISAAYAWIAQMEKSQHLLISEFLLLALFKIRFSLLNFVLKWKKVKLLANRGEEVNYSIEYARRTSSFRCVCVCVCINFACNWLLE